MVRLQKTIRLLTLAIMVFIGNNAISQTLQTYSGSFHDGQATYTYYDSEEGRVYDGNFHYKLPYYHGRASSKSSGSVEINGKFKNDLRNGLWVYTKHCNYKRKDNTVVHYKETLKVEYKDGVRNGIIEYFYTKDGETLESLESINTSNGMLNGKLKLFLNNDRNRFWIHRIEGEILNGIPVGIWKTQCNVLERKDVKSGSYLQYYDYDTEKSYYIDNETGEKFKGLYSYVFNGGYSSLNDILFFIIGIETTDIDKGFKDGVIKFQVEKKTNNEQNNIAKKESDNINAKEEAKDDDIVYEENQITKDPIFPAGIKAMYNYIEDNINYDNIKSKAQGMVYAEFTVGKNGNIRDVRILKSLNTECDKEAERVLLSMPKWIPAQKKGKEVSVKQKIAIRFKNKK